MQIIAATKPRLVEEYNYSHPRQGRARSAYVGEWNAMYNLQLSPFPHPFESRYTLSMRLPVSPLEEEGAAFSPELLETPWAFGTGGCFETLLSGAFVGSNGAGLCRRLARVDL